MTDLTDAADRVRRDAVWALRPVLGWRLAPGQWKRLGSLLDDIAEAAAKPDPDVLAQCVLDLQVADPLRITPIGAHGARLIPPPVRERVNVLIHRLSPADDPADDPAPTGPRKPGGGAGATAQLEANSGAEGEQ